MLVVSLLRSNGMSNRPVGDLTVASLGGKVQVPYRCFHGTQIQGILQYGTHLPIQPQLNNISNTPRAVPDCFILTSTGNLLGLSGFLLLQVKSAELPQLKRTTWMIRECLSLQ